MTEALRVQKMLIDQNNEIDRLRNRIEKLEAALREITLIENQEYGPDWDEIDLARTIARKALEGKDDPQTDL